jgi:hypothetical protein
VAQKNPTAKSSTEEVIEKRDASPVAAACLILAAVALLGALALQIAEIAEYREGFLPAQAEAENPAGDLLRRDLRAFEQSVDSVLTTNAVPGGAEVGAPAGAGSAEEPAEEPAAEPEEPAAEPEEPAEEPAAEPEEPAEEPAAEPEEPAAEPEEAAAETSG